MRNPAWSMRSWTTYGSRRDMTKITRRSLARSRSPIVRRVIAHGRLRYALRLSENHIQIFFTHFHTRCLAKYTDRSPPLDGMRCNLRCNLFPIFMVPRCNLQRRLGLLVLHASCLVDHDCRAESVRSAHLLTVLPM